jgi:hypothetical protein
MTYDHFGKLLTQGLKSVAALEKTELTEVQLDLGRDIGVSVWTIYKWRKGTSIPQDDRTIAMLARACVDRGRMDRQWLTEFLTHTIYSNKQALLNDLCPEKEPPVTVRHNLPRRQHVKLIGREAELSEILSFLSPRHRVGVVCISGGGGIGKTALALEIAHHCCREAPRLPPAERFEAIIWVTAKTAELLPAGQVRRQPTFTDLDTVYRAIAELLDIPAIFRAATQPEKSILIARYLTEHRVLLMLDNLENVDDQELMVFLRDLPAPSKAIVTTRHRVEVAVPVFLRMLNEETAQELIRLECEQHHISLTDEQIRLLLQRTGRLPLAIIRTLSRMAWRGSSVETELQHLIDPHNDIYDFCFSTTLALIRSSMAYELFMTLALFVTTVPREAVGFAAGCANVFERDEGLSDLEVLSLAMKDDDSFGLEPLTRTQALAELGNNAAFEAEARERWVGWYLNFTERYGGPDKQEMHLRYDSLDADWDNILEVIEWCKAQNRYSDVERLWHHLRDFTHIYGYWSDRVRLLNWLIGEAQARGEWDKAIPYMYDRAFTLILTRLPTQLDEAETMLESCWTLREYVSHVVQVRIAALTASLCLRQSKFDEAASWLDLGENLLSRLELPPEEIAREHASLLYDRGESWVLRGNYLRAQSTFEEMQQQAALSGWQRSVAYAQNWLAYTAILQGDLEQGEKFLHMGWPVVNRIKEKRLAASFRRTFTFYFRALGKRDETLQWAEGALDSFERLGMLPEVREMQAVIEETVALLYP